MIVRIGTRGSDLALAQARLVADALRARHPNIDTGIVPIRTTGDVRAEARLVDLGGKGAFTLEIERALLDGSIDFAVHSMKDMPARETEGLATLPALARESPWDALLAREETNLDRVRKGFRVGTSSPRRRAQLLARWPHLDVVEMRGNVPTRVEKMLRGDCDAIVLAEAGLNRLGLAPPWMRRLSAEEMIPAPHQGMLALQYDARANGAAAELAASLAEPDVVACYRAEREASRGLGATCDTPLGILAAIEGDGSLKVAVRLLDADGGDVREGFARGDRARAAELGREAAKAVSR